MKGEILVQTGSKTQSPEQEPIVWIREANGEWHRVPR